MPDGKIIRRGRPLYLISIKSNLINADMRFHPTEEFRKNAPTYEGQARFPLICTNLKKAMNVLQALSGNISFQGEPVTFDLPSYDKIRDDIIAKDGRYIKHIYVKEETPEHLKHFTYNGAREFFNDPNIGKENTFKVMLEIRREYPI